MPVPHDVNDVHFIDAEHGWAVGEGGFVITSLNGGRDWIRLPSPVNEELTLVRFADANRGWAVTSRPAGTFDPVSSLIGTSDGGQSWKLLAPVAPLNIQQLWVVNGSTLVASGRVPGFQDQTIISRDGGASWRVASMPRVTHVGSSGALWSMSSDGLWLSSDLGLSATLSLPCRGLCWLGKVGLDDDERLIVTTEEWSLSGPDVRATRHTSADGGGTWTSSPLNKPVEQPENRFAPTAFFGGGAGWALSQRDIQTNNGGTRAIPAALWRTSDNGATWSQVALPSWLEISQASISSNAFLDPRTMWLTIDGRAILTSDGGSTWRQLEFPAESEGPQFIRSGGGGLLIAAFASSLDRWYTSGDGGREWRQLPWARQGSDTSFYSVWFLDDQRGFVMAQDGLRRTDDGGRAWRKQELPPAAPVFGQSLQFTPDGVGWALAGGQLYRSADRGDSWQLRPLPAALAGRVRGAQFVDGNRGWIRVLDCPNTGDQVIRCASSLNATVDSGLTWQELGPIDGYDAEYSAVAFADANVGVMKTYDSAIYRTVDGGRSWTAAFTPRLVTGRANSIYFRNAREGWMLPSFGPAVAWRTTDAGQTWSEVALPAGSMNLWDIRFADERHGWIVGQNGIVLYTNDGGESWSRQATGTGDTLFAVFPLNEKKVWAGGGRSTILATATGGQ